MLLQNRLQVCDITPDQHSVLGGQNSIKIIYDHRDLTSLHNITTFFNEECHNM